MDNVKENELPSVLKDTDHWEKASVSQRTQLSLPGPLQWWPGAVRPLAGKGVLAAMIHVITVLCILWGN